MNVFLRSMERAVLLRVLVISAVFVVLFVALAVFVSIDGADSRVVKTTTGIVDVVSIHTKKGEYDHSALKLLGSNAQYTYDHAAFTPAMTDDLLAGASKVDLWYTENALKVPRIIALQIYDGQGEHPVKYATQDYLQPDRVAKQDSIMASIFAVVAVISAIIFIIVLRSGRRKPEAGDALGELRFVRSRVSNASPSAPAAGQPRRDDTPFWEQQLRDQQRERGAR